MFQLVVRSCIQGLKGLVTLVRTEGRLSLLDEQLYNKLVLLVELAVVEGKAKEHVPVRLSYPEEFLQALADADADTAEGTLQVLVPSHVDNCFLNGDQEGRDISGDIMFLLASDHPLTLGAPSPEKPKFSHAKHGKDMQSTIQHFAVSHADIHIELLDVCIGMLVNCELGLVNSQEGERQLQIRLNLASRILKLLCLLSKVSSQFPISEDTINRLLDLVAWIPELLMLEDRSLFQEVNSQDCCYVTFLSSVLALVEAVSLDECLFHNLRIYVAASAVDLFDAAKLEQGGGSAQRKLLVVFKPQVVSFISGLIKATHAQIACPRKKDGCNSTFLSSSSSSFNLQLRSQDFPVHVLRNHSEAMQVVLPSGGNWLPNLLGVVSLLYPKGMEAMPGIEKSVSLHKKENPSSGLVEHPVTGSEDEALFGDLFSESSRHTSSNEACAESDVIDRRPSGSCNTFLQAVVDVLTILRDCFFCWDCSSLTHKAAQMHMSREDLDVLLGLFFCSLSENVDRTELPSSLDVVAQIHKANFDVLHSIVGKGALPCVLEEHLVYAILEKGYSGCTIPNKMLVLLGKVLINHTSSQGTEQGESLKMAIWKSFTDTLVHTIQKGGWVELSGMKVSASLPSIFYIEVLLMAFHSMKASGRSCVMKTLMATVKCLCDGSQELEGSCLIPLSLLFSRLVMVLRYMVLHFKSFPRWLLVGLKNNLTYHAGEDSPKSDLEESFLLSSAMQAVVQAGSVGEGTGIDDDFLLQLFDVNAVPSHNGDMGLAEAIGLETELSELCSVIRCFLEGWRGKVVNQAKDLIVERYAFSLGWFAVRDFGKQIDWAMPSVYAYAGGNLPGADFHLMLTQSLYSYFNQDHKRGAAEWWKFFVANLTRYETAVLGDGSKSLTLVDNLRQGSVLHMLLLFLQKGLQKFTTEECVSDSVDVHKREVLDFCEQLVYNCIEDEYFCQLIKILSCVLSWYVEALRHSVLNTVGNRQMSDPTVSSMYLVLVAGLNRTKQEEMCARLGVSFSVFEKLLRWGMPASWHDETLSKFAGFAKMGTLDKIVFPSLLHGHPCSSHPWSAMVVSCMSLVECILEIIRLLLNVNQSLPQYSKESLWKNAVSAEPLDVLMTIKLDENFEVFHPKCEEIMNVMLPLKEEQARCNDLHILKQQESLLKNISGNKEIHFEVREELIVHAVESLNKIYLDPARIAVFWQHFTSGGGHISFLIDVLDGSYQETVNVKVLELLLNVIGGETSVQAGLKSALQEKLLMMDKEALCLWLEQRLLGHMDKSAEGGSTGWTSSNTVKDLTAGFLCGLVSCETTMNREHLRSHLVNALLLSLEQAFNFFDIAAVSSYFTLLIQLASKGVLLRQVILSVVNLLGKLPFQGSQVEGLKALLAFLVSVLIACGGQKAQTLTKSTEGKHWSHVLTSTLNSANKAELAVSRRSSETPQTTMEQSGQSASADCDAISIDDDEDDGTSDGEITSLDKDEDDDGSNTEKALASRVCTFTSSGNNFMEQHWYFCYTCDLTVSKGCCSICARVCHRGHKVVYSRLSRFFCDCGAGGVRGSSCLCLKPRKYVPPASTVSTAGQDPPSDSESELEDDLWADNEILYKMLIGEGEEKQLLAILADLDVEGQILSLCERLLSGFNWSKYSMPSLQVEIGLGENKRLIAKSDFLQFKRGYKSGSLDMKIKADYPNAKELKSHLVSGSLVKSLLSASSRGKLAAGEGDKVTIFDVEQLIGQPTAAPVTVDRANVKPLSKNPVRFELVHLMFNSVNESYLAVAGYEDCQIFTVNSRGEVTDRLAVELALQDAYIRRVVWVPGSQVQLMVVTNKFVKIYDLSQDNISPVHYFTILEDTIVDASLLSIGQGVLVLLVLSYQGVLYSQSIAAGADPGARVLTDIISVPEKYQLTTGASLHFSPALRLLFLSYSDGLSLIGRMNADGTSLGECSSVIEMDQDDKPCVAGLHHWKEVLDGSGLFVCLSSQRSNSAVAVCIGPIDIESQYLRATGTSGTPRIDGIAAYKSMTKERSDLLILHDDGSLQIFSYTPGGDSTNGGESVKNSNLEKEQVKKLGDVLFSRRASNAAAPVFPLDFFEKTNCITGEIRLGGDVLRNNDSEGAKLTLASDDGFLEGPSPTGFKITVINPNPDIVMVGCRVHVGNSSTSHIPSELRVFQRVLKLEEGVRCWYDVPFTNAEALLADEEFTLTVGPTFGGYSLPRIDSLEVYGRPKDDFGWKEKIDAILDMESRASASGSVRSGTKYKMIKNAPVEVQIVADCFRVLYGYYVARRAFDVDDGSLEVSRKRCQPLLELVFESDRQPLMQAAARRVLRALYPQKDAFYQAKDNMRLTGISHACPFFASKVGFGSAATLWVVQEFTAHMRAICKIALHRIVNLASFLDCHGPSLVDGLMKVLWDILSAEQPDSETVNNLVIPCVDLIYGYAECLAIHESNGIATSMCVAPAVTLFQKLLFAPYDAVRASCSLAMSSRLLQVPFPKQTMLASDDVAEISRAMSLPSGSGAVSGALDGQGTVEEDGGNASVQYCCDGCSRVPIVGRRWHCNVCPDFDLCEACYEVMDGDRLPPPHSGDHPMSAIPIEIESTVGGEGSDIHFSSIDELSDENLLQVATELSMQSTSAPLSSSNTAGSRGDIQSAAVEFKGVTISASKRVLNSLLLRSFVDEIKGWMRSTSGAQAVPLMQFFYRLASASMSPFVEDVGTESIDLERFIKLMLEELNLSVPLSVKSRSSFGEVVILVFTFFNLMLRNWHQPGSDQTQVKSETVNCEASQATPSSSGTGSPSSDSQEKCEVGLQLDRACAALRQQQLMNYLLSIVQQLAQVFKSSSRSQESCPVSSAGALCGALLTVRREFAAGNFAPYFTDSYAKAHRDDLFGDFHRLLLESTFRLAYNLVRPEKPEKTGEKDQISSKIWLSSDLKLDGWQEVLCMYINNPHTTSIRRFARRLLLHMCGTKGLYYNVRDTWQLSREVKKLFKLVQKSGGFQGLVLYERSVKLFKCLSAIAEVAAARPRNWQKYCSRHPDILQFLFSGIFSFGEESVLQTLKLLTLAFYAGKELGTSSTTKGESADSGSAGAGSGTKQSSQVPNVRNKKGSSGDDAIDGIAEKAFLDMELAVDQFAAEDGKVMMQFIDVFLLEWNLTSVRTEAKAVMFGTWHHGRHSVRALILKVLLQKVPVLPSYGQNIAEYTDLLTWILGKGTPGSGSSSQENTLVQSCLTGDVVKGTFDTLCSQNELLANHPNSKIYNTLSSLVDFDGYYLESEPCLACSCPEVPYTRMKLDSLKSETKFTDNRILVKCVGSHTIQSVTMNVHDARRSKSVKVLNLYYNNRPVTDLSELKNNWSLWKRAKSCYLAFNQTELKVDFPIPITACNFMIELDSFYENLQASSLESLQCPRCSRYVTDKHGICGNCHENAYQCRQCRNINYENLDSFLCNECGYSKYGRFEFNFMAKPSFHFESMENDEDMKKGLAAIEVESENAHRRYQQLLGFKKPLLKLVLSIGETEMDSQQKDSVQQMIVSLPGSSSFKINRKIAILGVLYGEKCKMAFDSVSRSVQTLQGLRQVLTSYLEQKKSLDHTSPTSKLFPSRPSNRCYGCANTFVGQCLEWLQIFAKIPHCRQQLVSAGILSELFENNIHQGSKSARTQARAVLCAFTEGDAAAVGELNNLIKQKATYCLDHHRSIDIATCVREELQLLSETCALIDEFWEARLRIVFQLLFSSIQVGARHPVIAEHIILPCLRIISQACTPPKSEAADAESTNAPPGPRPEVSTEETAKAATAMQRTNSSGITKAQPGLYEKDIERESKGQDVPLVNYVEWKNGATYVDFVRRQYTASQSAKPVVQKLRRDPKRADFLALKYMLRWKRRACKLSVTSELSAFEESSWVCELVLSACSQAIRMEMCGLIGVLCAQSPARRTKFLNLLMALLPATRTAGESACDYFELLYKMIEPEDARLFLTMRGFLRTLCRLITEEVSRIEAQEHSFHIDISQGYILHKFIELLGKFLQVSNIRLRFMKDGLLSQVLEALLVVRGLVVQKTKLIGDCSRLLRDLLDSLLQESFENKRHFIRACIAGLQTHGRIKKDRTLVFILELLCNIICPTKPEPAYMLVLNKAHTQEEFIRGSMTKNPYSSLEIGPLMRDVKNKICHQLDLLGLLEDDYGMELLVAGNIISLDLSVAQVYEQVWKKAQNQASSSGAGIGATVPGGIPGRECPPMTVTYRLQGLDGEATEPMIKELDDDREESQDPEVEFAITGVMRECDGLEIILNMVQTLSDNDIKSSHEEFALVLKLLMYCCKIQENRLALLHLRALGVLIETARRAFVNEATESAEGLLLIVEYLVTEANESDMGMAESSFSASQGLEGPGGEAAHVVLMFLERLSYPSGAKTTSKQQRNNDMVARILPYLTYGEQAAMEVLVKHFEPYLHDWSCFDELQRKHSENMSDENLSQEAAKHQLALENFWKVTESIKHDAQGDRLKGLIMEKGITTDCIHYLKEVFQVFESGSDYRATAGWGHGLELHSIPIILSILRGLSRRHLLTQRCLDQEGVLPLLHALEGVPGESEIGAKAENLLDTLADKDGKGEGFLTEKVMKLRHATHSEMRKRALQKREELLQGLGMRRELTSDGGERIVISQPSIEGLDDVEEEEAGLACMVCREGYSLRPTDMLGAYCYSKRVNLGTGTSSNARAEWVYTTVSYFNVIHFQCHQEAKRADASLKNPKKEWEGAALRNNETLCNNLFPLRGPSVPLAQYARCVDQYWDHLSSLGRADGSRLRLLTYDIVLMLARFATGASFSTDCKGGGKESNSRLLPFMLQIACHLLDQGGVSQRRIQSKALVTYLSCPPLQEPSASASKSSTASTPQRLAAVDETVQFMMVQSLLLESLDDWQHHRRTFLQRGIYHAYMQFKHGRTTLAAPPSPSPVPSPRISAEFSSASSDTTTLEDANDDSHVGEMNGEQLFAVVQPMLIYTGLVNQLQCYLKQGGPKSRGAEQVEEEQCPSGAENVKVDGGSGHAALELWEVTMKDRLRDVKAMLGFSKDLLEWLDDMQGAEDLQEAFDVMGALGDVFSSGFSSCEEFVLDAINSATGR